MSTQDNKPDTSSAEKDGIVRVTTPEYVKELIQEHAQSRNHPEATLKDKGFVSLSNDINSDSETSASTPRAVKTAYDLANAANQNANNANENADNANKNANNANENANTRLAKDQNGADIPNKKEFVKNLGLESLMGEFSLPVGVPVPWPTESAPAGWLICNGDPFDKTKYPKLALAYPSGVLPDLRGEFIRGLDNGRGADPDRKLLTHQEGTIVSGFDDNDTGDISSIGAPQYAFGDPMTPKQWENIKGKKWIYWNKNNMSNRYDWWAYVSARPRNVAFNYIVRAA
ncbi:tail protein [Xenorhabdus mauleonii]|uniref:Phage Tail Collar Domain n=1 Tax=Xenorhabdus mauleonii TaxID=351675 RepID=A0A1I3URW8_9GAMM|nr:phage tail protein [Xenorhabdus mauleonii]PHM37991.1 tail protein [Xenorhabdus mauleonii]SFJ86084.1 Phage Tail Collar Domain [Xenorhabdus mauleonii]